MISKDGDVDLRSLLHLRFDHWNLHLHPQIVDGQVRHHDLHPGDPDHVDDLHPCDQDDAVVHLQDWEV